MAVGMTVEMILGMGVGWMGHLIMLYYNITGVHGDRDLKARKRQRK